MKQLPMLFPFAGWRYFLELTLDLCPAEFPGEHKYDLELNLIAIP